MLRKIILFMLLFFAFMSPCQAQNTAGSNPARLKFSERKRIADSLRVELRRAADEGRMLQWGDSILKTRLDSGVITKRRFDRLSKNLVRYDKFLSHGDSVLASRYGKITYDTMYIHRPPGRWTVKFRANLSGATIGVEGVRQSGSYSGRLKSDYRGTLSASVSYRGLSLGLAVNPLKLVGKSKDNEFNINSYGNKFGFDVSVLSSKTYKGYVEENGLRMNVDKGAVKQRALNANVYYAFNGKRFSIPAAFSQNYIQKRSAGSFLLGASLDGQITDIDENAATNGKPVKLKIVEFAIGAGYGYNYVANRHLLFHISALPAFDVLAKSHVTVGDERVNLHYRFPNCIITGRGAVVYSWRNKFAGGSMLFNFSSFGSKDRLHIMRNKVRIRLFYGFRF